MNIQIRPALPQDIPALAEVLRSVEWFTPLIETPLQELHKRMLRSLELCLNDDSHLVLVAEGLKKDILGFVSVHWLPYFILDGPEGYVSELFVHKDARGLGAGTLLINAIKDEARKRGCSRLMLVNHRDRPSYQREFYKKNGWREREALANFVFDLH
jgi:GNAT superfamily N-acetyltransferase